MMEQYPQLFAPLITHTRPIDQIQQSFEMLEHGGGGAAKVVLTFPTP
jgi:threonine dehydrogenase-like Zn-dependent dehydrogenase